MPPPPSSRQRGPAPGQGGSKATSVNVVFDSNLRSSLAHLPPAVYSALVARDIPPQNIVLQLTRVAAEEHDQHHDAAGQDDADNAHRHTVFLGWTGQSSNIESTLVLSASLAKVFHPAADPSSAFTLTLLRSPPLPTATRVHLTPLTPDDWELLSQNAGAVEDNMLSQVRSVSAGGRVCIFVGRNSSQECFFAVDSTEPSTSSASSATNGKGKEKDKTPARAVRLTTSTEIVIAPRTRQSHAQAAANEQHVIGGSASASASSSSAYVSAAIAARAKTKHKIYKVLSTEYSPVPSSSSSQYDLHGDTPIAVISAQPDEADEADLDWSLLSQAFGTSQKSDFAKATVTLQPCPTASTLRPMTDHDKGSTSADASSEASGIEDQSKNTSTSSKPTRPTTAAFLVRGTAQIQSTATGAQPLAWPSGWVWANEALRSKLGKIGAGETICFASPPPSGSSAAPPASSEANRTPKARPPSSVGSLQPPPGTESLLTNVRQSISNAMSPLSHSTQSVNILLHGPSGVGKTRIAQSLAAQLRVALTTTLYVDCSPLSEMRISQLKATFKEWRDALDWYARATSTQTTASGAVLILDNLDKVLIAEVENMDPTRARTLAECFVQTFATPNDGGAHFSASSTAVLATASSSTSLHKLLAEKHVWSESIGIKPPGKQDRADILAYLVRQKAGNKDTSGINTGSIEADPKLNYILLSAQTEGYLPADLVDLVDRAIYRAAVRMTSGEQQKPDLDAPAIANGRHINGGTGRAYSHGHSSRLLLTLQDFTSAQENFTPLSLRSLSLSSSGSVSWSSIGGLQETRRVLRETLEFPSRYAQIFASCPLRLRSGLLLYGYPGCGKTMLASAVAKECGANFVSVKGPEILNKYIGASEKSVRDLFERASAAKPCVLFFDEFDSIAPKRGHDSTGVTDRVVNQLLTQMDGAEGLSGVYVLAATSRPDLIDSALLRPGRLDKSLLCDMPSAEDREDILRAVVKEGKIHIDETDVKWSDWAEKTEGFSGADLQALVYNAHLEVVHEGISSATAAADGQDADKNNASESGATGQGLTYVEVKGQTSDADSAAATAGKAAIRRSGAEEQALLRRLEMAIANSKRARGGSGKGATTDKSKAESGSEASLVNGTNTKVASASRKLVTSAHLSRSLASMRPSVPLSERQRLERIYREFAGSTNGETGEGKGKGKGRAGDFPSGEASREIGARESLM